MKTFVKCEMCKARVPSGTCVFAIHKRVIDGKEYIYCCPIMQRKKSPGRACK